MSWTVSEQKAYEWFKQNYDPNAIKLGGSDSTVSDIQSSLYGIIEVKEAKAQYGQFTLSTINENPLSKLIVNKGRENVTGDDARAWCRYHYLNKGVKYMLIVNGDDCTLYPINTFFDSFNFKLENRTTKRSGSRALPQIAIPFIPKEWKATLVDGKYIVKNPNYWDSYAEYTNRGKVFTMSPTSKSNGEIRVLSNTNNETWIFTIDK